MFKKSNLNVENDYLTTTAKLLKNLRLVDLNMWKYPEHSEVWAPGDKEMLDDSSENI